MAGDTFPSEILLAAVAIASFHQPVETNAAAIAPLEYTPAQADCRRFWLFLYLVFNIIGLFIFFLVVAGIQSRAQLEERNYYDFGDSLIYILFGLPPLAICVLINLGGAINAVSDAFKRRNYSPAITLFAVVAAWLAIMQILGLKPWGSLMAPV